MWYVVQPGMWTFVPGQVTVVPVQVGAIYPQPFVGIMPCQPQPVPIQPMPSYPVVIQPAHALPQGGQVPALPPGIPQDGLSRPTVVLQADSRGHFYAPVSFNGREPVQSLIDTGCTDVSIPYEVAEKLGLDPEELEFNELVSTANGYTREASVVLDRVCIGMICAEDIKASVSKPGKLDEPLIGMAFLTRLSRYRVEGNFMILEA